MKKPVQPLVHVYAQKQLRHRMMSTPVLTQFLFFLFFFLSSCATQRTKIVSPTSQPVPETSKPSLQASEESAASVSVDKQKNSIKKDAAALTESTPATSSQPVTEKKMKKKPLFDWPVWEARLSRGFLPKGTRRSRRPHKGIDLAAQRGTAVMAAHDGLVIYAGKEFKGYGKMIMIEVTSTEGQDYATLYGHLDKIVVFEGQKVRQGEVIGALGNTGRSSGPHLHFEIRKLDGPVDPLPYLPAGTALSNDVDDPSAPKEE